MTHLRILILFTIGFSALGIRPCPAKEFLTPQEITKIQDAQEIDLRIRIYLDAAVLRVKTITERLAGKESVAGDPLEFFTIEDMAEGYYRILHSVMLNLEDAASHPKTDQKKLQSALTSLKKSTEMTVKQLEILKKTALEQRKEKLYDLIERAIAITKGANEGAATALAKKYK